MDFWPHPGAAHGDLALPSPPKPVRTEHQDRPSLRPRQLLRGAHGTAEQHCKVKIDVTQESRLPEGRLGCEV